MKTEIMTLNAKDLTKEYPRSPRETLAGYVIAARMLDKCRAAISGTLGEYHFDCPLDHPIWMPGVRRPGRAIGQSKNTLPQSIRKK